MASVDVIIPVYRPDEKLNRLLIALKTQTVLPGKIILVHTGEALSGEPDYSAHDNVVLHRIEAKDFDHGGTRNLGASLSEAEVMVFMTQDAVPADDCLLERLTEALSRETAERGVEIAAAYARQLPYEDCRAVERYIRVEDVPSDQVHAKF